MMTIIPSEYNGTPAERCSFVMSDVPAKHPLKQAEEILARQGKSAHYNARTGEVTLNGYRLPAVMFVNMANKYTTQPIKYPGAY